jgi:hypothetical protein
VSNENNAASAPVQQLVEHWLPIAQYDYRKHKRCVFFYPKEGGRSMLTDHVSTDRYTSRQATHFLMLPPLPNSVIDRSAAT